MAIDCEVDHKQKLVVTTYRGAISDQDLDTLMTVLREGVGVGASYVALTEMVDADLGAVTAEGVRRLVDGLVSSRVIRSNAIFVGDDLAFGLGRMFSALLDASGIRVEVFRQRVQAETWLGVARPREP